jgi:cytochrome c556
MKKGIAVLGVLFTMGLVWADDKLPGIDEIMEKAHASKTGLRAKIDTEAKKPSPDWVGVQKNAKEFVSLAEALAKHDAPKGDKNSWKKLSKEYSDQVKELQKSADKKDGKAVVAANQKLGANCMGCHDAHRD